jgi:predicted small metal-binding protein
MANVTGNNQQKTFRCADLGHKECNWQVSGQSEEELMPQIEQHGRQAHNIQKLDNKARNRVRGAIRERAA